MFRPRYTLLSLFLSSSRPEILPFTAMHGPVCNFHNGGCLPFTFQHPWNVPFLVLPYPP